MKCNGSRLNVIQSGMMGACDKVYLVEPGKQALMKDVVHIWEYADVDPKSKKEEKYNDTNTVRLLGHGTNLALENLILWAL